ncbi:Fis family transcriptional regulator [Motilimonas cestriensis]|uniref:Fis family transcriptional regulator n=1 Tax=Motilimonas cestriensis TaxID=2742685 RepID=A0ABS8W5U0_9GAMM|nr:Fis family transcriptional regulator [Motilimonas cestriensis]MCE2593655.1 Fis family transcriptional regulator [Motilimonas cestriensis]
MRKIDKKIEQQIVTALTQVCDQALTKVAGFEWLTHSVNYQQVSTSLLVTCVFTEQDQLRQCLVDKQDALFKQWVEQALAKQGIKLKNVQRQVQFDSESACKEQHNGNWSKRLAKQ